VARKKSAWNKNQTDPTGCRTLAQQLQKSKYSHLPLFENFRIAADQEGRRLSTIRYDTIRYDRSFALKKMTGKLPVLSKTHKLQTKSVLNGT